MHSLRGRPTRVSTFNKRATEDEGRRGLLPPFVSLRLVRWLPY